MSSCVWTRWAAALLALFVSACGSKRELVRVNEPQFGEALVEEGTIVGDAPGVPPRLVVRDAPVRPASAEEANYVLIVAEPRESVDYEEVPLVGPVGLEAKTPAGAAFNDRLRAVQEQATREGGSVVVFRVSYGTTACRVIDDHEWQRQQALRGRDPFGCYVNEARPGERTYARPLKGYLIVLLKGPRVTALWAFDESARPALLRVSPSGYWAITPVHDSIEVLSHAVVVQDSTTPPIIWQRHCSVYGTIDPKSAPPDLAEQIANAHHDGTKPVPVCVNLDEAW